MERQLVMLLIFIITTACSTNEDKEVKLIMEALFKDKIEKEMPVDFLEDAYVGWNIHMDRESLCSLDKLVSMQKFANLGKEKDYSNCFVYYANHCGIECGGGSLLVFEKNKGVWKLVIAIQLWIA